MNELTTIPAQYLFAPAVIAPVKDVRYYLNGVLLHTHGTVATDGHRLASCTFFGEPALPEGTKIIIPSAAIQALGSKIKAKGQSTGTVTVSAMDGGMYMLTYNGVTGTHQELFTPVNGTYPDWRRVLPDEEKIRVIEMTGGCCFNWSYMADFEKIAALLGDKSKRVILHPGVHDCDGARVTILAVPEFVGVIMPLKK